MAITATQDQTTSSTATPTLALGFTATAGDLIICAAGQDGSSTVTWPGSWVELADADFTAAHANVAYLIAAGGETSVQPTSTLAERWEAIFWRIPAGEWHGTTPPEINTRTTGSSTAPDSGSITPSWGSAATHWLSLCFRDDSVLNTVSAYPTNYSDAQSDNNATTSACNVAGAVRSSFTATSEDPGAFTLSASETWAAYTVAIRPAAGGGSNVTATPGTASLTVTAQTPSVSVSDNRVATPGVVALTLTRLTPTVTATANQVATPGVQSLTLTTFAPAIAVGVNVVPGVASLALSPQTPTVTVSANQTATPGVASLSLTAQAPTVTASDHKTATIGLATLAVTAFAPTVSTAVSAQGDATVTLPITHDAAIDLSVVHTAVLSLPITHEATMTLTATDYDIGDIASPTVDFAVSGVATDPTTISLTVTKPDLTATVYTYAGGGVSRLATGQYRKNVSVDTAGVWIFRFVGTGACEAAVEATITVRG